MSGFWKQWENQLVNGLFPLRRFLSATSHSAVFLTECEAAHGAAAIKFIRSHSHCWTRRTLFPYVSSP